MRYIFGCAVLCLGLSAAHALPSQPDSISSSSDFRAADFTPSRMIEEAQSRPESADEPEVTETKETESAKRVVSREEICDSVAAAAQANDLPIAFLASLVWQESRFNPKAVSPVGAQGIAQFMPKVAAAFGLADPFDPLQALPASAKFLRELYQQFGNLGLAAAAYNAGPKRVLDWMANRGRLPAETRAYVINITGRPAEQWVAKIDNAAFKIPARTPCQNLAGLPEWSSAGSGQLTPDLPDVVVAEAPKPKPMIVITKDKVIVTGPQPKTLTLKQPKTQVAATQSKALVTVAQSKTKAATTQSKAVVTIAQTKTQVATTQSKALITVAQSKTKVATAPSKAIVVSAQSKTKAKFAIAQPKSIVAAERTAVRQPENKKAQLAEQEKKASPAQGKGKVEVTITKVAGKAAGKSPVRPVAAQRIRTAAART
jgi:hypothetical protein